MRFIETLETLPDDPERTYGGRTASEWLTWARERRAAFDPLCWRQEMSGPILRLSYCGNIEIS
jgi:hypothetical protein